MLNGVKVTKGLLNALDSVKKPQTNADRIRAMSDEELAKFVDGKRVCPPTSEYPKVCGDCVDCWLEWLQRPAEKPEEDAM